jgi:hypothetical protein
MGVPKFTNGIDLVNQKAINAADPSAATDLVTLQYMQAYVRGLSWKPSVLAASTANVTLASPGTTLDGVTLTNPCRVLLKNQTAGAENGIYIWTASGSALTRATDADSAAELVGAAVTVEQGTVNADRVYTQNADAITLGTTTLTWVQLGGGSTYTAGNGLSLTGSAFAVVAGNGIIADGTSTRADPAVVARKYATSVGDGSSTSITVTHSLNNADSLVQVFENSSGQVVYPDVSARAANTVTVAFATAPTTNQYRVVVVA